MATDACEDLGLFLGSDWVINQHITIRNRSIGEIADFGEHRYLSLIYLLTCTPSDLISILYDAGIDWEEISDFDLFCFFISQEVNPEDSKFVIEGINFSEFSLGVNENNEPALFNKDGVVIDDNIYRLISDGLRKMHGLKRNVRKAGNKFTKELMIEVDRQDRERAAKEKNHSSLLPLVSSVMTHFGYNKSEMRDMPYFAFLDCINRIVAEKRADTLSIGSVCGMADLKKVPKKEFNWLRDLTDK